MSASQCTDTWAGMCSSACTGGVVAVTPVFATVGLPGNPVDGITVANMRIPLRVRRDDPGSLAVPNRSSAYPTGETTSMS